MIICKDLNEEDCINTIQEWKKKCPPERGDFHWKEKRSAKELAKEWIYNNGSNFKKILNQNNEFKNTELIRVAPELETRFDKYGRGRKHDLLILGQQDCKKTVISIEAKADESFGNNTVGRYYLKGILKQLNETNTNVPARIEGLIKSLFKKPYKNKIFKLQYQLLHAIAGTLTEAKIQNSDKALFVVNTFISEEIGREKLEVNNKKFNKFLNVFSSGQYHIIPHNCDMKLFWNKNNWQSLCKKCHSRKTALKNGAFGNMK